MIIEAGRVCLKVRGKNAGKYCVVLGKTSKNLVEVVGKGMKKGKVNISHLEPLPKVLKVRKTSKAATIAKQLEKEGF